MIQDMHDENKEEEDDDIQIDSSKRKLPIIEQVQSKLPETDNFLFASPDGKSP